MNKYLLIFFYIIVLVLFSKYYKKRRLLLSPASIYTIYWSIFSIMGLFFDDGVYPYSGMYWILASVMFINAGQMLVLKTQTESNEISPTINVVFKDNVHKAIVLLLSVGLIVNALKGYFEAGGISNISKVAYDYYTNGSEESSLKDSLAAQILTISMYLDGFISGELFFMSKPKTKGRYLALLSFVPPIINMFTTSGKLGLIVVGIFFAIGYLIMSVQTQNVKVSASITKEIKRYWIIIPVLAIVFALSLALRMGNTNSEYLAIAFNKLKSYAFGSTMAFNAWFSIDELSAPGYGLNTFMGIPHALGLIERKMGVYQEFVTTTVWNTNVYTLFRAVIMDYGKIGGLVFVFLFGLIAGWSYKVYVAKRTNMSYLILNMSYLLILFSLFNSPYVYFNLSVMFIGITILRMFGYRFIQYRKTNDYSIQMNNLNNMNIKRLN